MNLRPPTRPTFSGETTVEELRAYIDDLHQWLEDLYRFLEFPFFHSVNFVPRESIEDTSSGTVYFDSDDGKLKVRSHDAWEDNN